MPRPPAPPSAPKQCPKCGRLFERRPGEGSNDWGRKTYCSKKCARTIWMYGFKIA